MKPDNTLYHGKPAKPGLREQAEVTVNQYTPLPTPENHLSPSLIRFSWGDDSLGTYQLAYALLCDCLESEERAFKVYEQFAADVIAKLDPGAEFALLGKDVRKALEKINPRGAA